MLDFLELIAVIAGLGVAFGVLVAIVWMGWIAVRKK